MLAAVGTAESSRSSAKSLVALVATSAEPDWLWVAIDDGSGVPLEADPGVRQVGDWEFQQTTTVSATASVLRQWLAVRKYGVVSPRVWQ